MRPRRRAVLDLLVPTTTAAAALAAAVVVAAVDPNTPGHYPTCPVLAVTGLFCTGCGTLRAMHALLHADLLGALAMNPLAVLLAPVAVVSWAAWFVRSWTGAPRRWLAPPWAVIATAVVLILFTVARNTSTFAPWLAPGSG